MKEAFEKKRLLAISAYCNFTTSQGSSFSWPDFDHENFEKVFCPPSLTTIIKIFHASFELIYPYLKRDLFNRVPGKCVKMDGTYRFLTRTKNDKESSEEAKCLHVVWNEWGHILSFAFAGSENSQCFQTLNYYIKKRCERLGKPVENVVAAFSDTCCDGNRDPSAHWITAIWPGCLRAPYADIFHAQKRITEATTPHHELSPLFCSLVSKSFLRFDESSADHVVAHYMQRTKSNFTHDVAIEKMLQIRLYKKKVKNFTPHNTKIEEALQCAYTTIETEDRKRRQEAERNGEVYMPLLQSPKKAVRRGTKQEIENVLVHVRRGCCQDPFNLEEINVPVDPEADYPDYIRMRGTSQGEGSNRLINQLVTGIGIQTADMAHKRLFIFVTEYNLAKDKVLQKVLGLEKVRTMDWWIREALNQQHPGISSCSGFEFPPQLPEGYHEPVGVYYGRYKDFQLVKRHLARIDQLSPRLRSAGIEEESPPKIITRNDQSPPRKQIESTSSERPGDFYPPQAKWGRKLGPLSQYQVSIANTYLDSGKRFTKNNDVTDAYAHLGPPHPSTDSLLDVIVHNWNLNHFKQVQEHGNIGLGGMIRKPHVKSLMKEKGYKILEARIEKKTSVVPKKKTSKRSMVSELSTADASNWTKKKLKKSMVTALSKIDAGNWLKHLGLPLGDTVGKRHEILLKQFDGKAEDYELSS
jgi:hypothetical protein